MKQSSYILLILVLFASSCLKRIDLNLPDDEQRTVIDTRLYLGTHDFEVKLSKSGNYFGSNTIKDIPDASVSIFDGTISHQLDNIGDGLYRLSDFTTIENQEYKLTVEENGASHEASAAMVSRVEQDTLTFEYGEGIFGDTLTGYETLIDFQDPANFHNYYMIERKINNESDSEDFDVYDDELVDGNRLVFPVTDFLQLGDTVQVDLIAINKETYDYFSQLNLAIYGDGAAPANPDNNFGKDVLGNFSVMALSRQIAVVVE